MAIPVATISIEITGSHVNTTLVIPSSAHSIGLAAVRTKIRNFLPDDPYDEYTCTVIEGQLVRAGTRLRAELFGAWGTIPMF